MFLNDCESNVLKQQHNSEKPLYFLMQLASNIKNKISKRMWLAIVIVFTCCQLTFKLRWMIRQQIFFNTYPSPLDIEVHDCFVDILLYIACIQQNMLPKRSRLLTKLLNKVTYDFWKQTDACKYSSEPNSAPCFSLFAMSMSTFPDQNKNTEIFSLRYLYAVLEPWCATCS